MNPMMLASLFLPVLGSGWQTLQSRRANQQNRQTQQEALQYQDQQQRGLQGQLGRLSRDVLGSNAAINNQLLYGGGGGFGGGGNLPRGARRRADGSTPGMAAVGSGPQQGIPGQMGPQDLQGYAGRFGAAMDEFNRGRGELLTGYQNRVGDTMKMLDNFGNSARENLNQQYQNTTGGILQDAASRGLTNSTVLGSMRLGAQKQHDQSTRALEEQVSTQKANAYQGLTGDFLNAYGGLLGQGLNLRTGLSGDFLGALDATNTRDQQLRQQLGMAGIGMGERGMDRRLGIMQGYPAQGPPPGNPFDAAAAGLNSVMAYQASRPQQSNSWFGPAAVGGGFNLASAGLLGSFLR